MVFRGVQHKQWPAVHSKWNGDVGQMSRHYHCISSHYSAHTLDLHHTVWENKKCNQCDYTILNKNTLGRHTTIITASVVITLLTQSGSLPIDQLDFYTFWCHIVKHTEDKNKQMQPVSNQCIYSTQPTNNQMTHSHYQLHHASVTITPLLTYII